jgi:type I restriction enzyme S subunit
MSEYTLPDGWRIIRLGEIGEIASGITLGQKLRNAETYRVPYLRVANVKDGSLDLSDVYEIEATSSEIEKLKLQYGDLLLTEGGDPDKLGRGTFWEEQLPICIHQNHIFRVRFDLGQVWPQFVSAQIASPYGKAYFFRYAKQTTGIATINQQVLRNFPLMLPPFSEQRRIATILTEQMDAIEQARAAAEAELAAAEALTAAYLREVFESEEVQQWEPVSLGEALVRTTEVVHPHDNPAGPAVFVGLEHIESGTGIRLGKVSVEMSELNGQKPTFYQGQIVYGYLRPYLNKVWIAEFDGLCSVDQYVYSVVPSLADTEFIAWFMRSPVYIERSPLGSNTSQLPRIRADEVASVEVNLPPVDEQKRIVILISEYLTETYALCASLKEELEAISQLPAALLCRAFNGEL